MATKPNFFSTLIQLLMRRPSEAAAAVRVGQVAAQDLANLEGLSESERLAAAALAEEATIAEEKAARLRGRIETLRAERQLMAESYEAAKQAAAAAFAGAVAAGDKAAEAAAMEASAEVRDGPGLIARADSMLSALDVEVERADRLAVGKRRQVEEAQRVAMSRRCEEASIQFDEAANALLLAAARVYAAHDAAGLMQPPQVQRLLVPHFSAARSVYSEVTGDCATAGHPPPVINAMTVRKFVRTVDGRESAPMASDSVAPA